MRRFSTRQYAVTLLDVLTEAKPAERPDRIRQFLSVLRRRHQLRLLPRIVDRLEAEHLRRHGQVRVLARSARPLPGSFPAALERALRQDVLLESDIDPKLIGGVSLRIGERLIDATIPAVLQSLRQHVTPA